MRWIAVVVCACLAAWLWWSGESEPPAPAGAPHAALPTAAGTSPAASARDPAAPPPTRSAAPVEVRWLENLLPDTAPPLAADADDPLAIELRGRLTVRQRPWLHPAGVEIRLTRHWLDSLLPTDAGPVPPPRTDEPAATTAADGTFALRCRPVDGALFFRIDRGGPWDDYQRVARLPAAGGVFDLGDVWLDDRGSIVGRVVAAEGSPIAGAVVRAIDDTLGDVAAGLGDLQALRSAGAAHWDPRGTTSFGALPAWIARRDAALPFPSITTTEDGAFTLRGLRPGQHDLVVSATVASGSLADVQVVPMLATEVGDVTLTLHTPVALQFLDERGAAWVGAEVAFVHERLGFGSRGVPTDGDGRAEGLVADAAATRVVFTYPGGGPSYDIGPLDRCAPIVEMRQMPLCTVSLAAADGTPLPGGRVRLYRTGAQFRAVDRKLPDWMQPTEVRPGTHAGHGFGDAVAVGIAPGYAPAIARFPPTSRALALTLVPLQQVTVCVRDTGGAPVTAATVRVQVHEHDDVAFVGAQWELLANDRATVGTTGADGRITVPVWGTSFSFGATHPDYAPAAGPCLVPVPGQVVDLQLHAPAGIVGRLVAQGRRVPAGLRVRARQTPMPGNRLDGSGFLGEQLAVVGDDGAFELRMLTAGIWQLQPEWPGLPTVAGPRTPTSSFAPLEVWLDPGQIRHCTLELHRPTLSVPQIAGIVRDRGAPVADALVRVRPVERPRPTRATARRRPRAERAEPAALPADAAPWRQQCTTDWFGDFEFAGLPPGVEHEVRVDVPIGGRLQFLGRQIVRTPHRENAPPNRVEFELATGSLELCGSTAGSPFAGRALRLVQQLPEGGEGADFHALTDALGRAFVTGLPAGRWRLTAVHGGTLAPDEVTIRPGAVTSLAIEAAPSADAVR